MDYRTQIKALAYAGIETKDIRDFVLTAKNPLRKQYKFGEVKKAIAKATGTNDVVYEVIYVDLIDPKNHSRKDSIKFYNSNRK